MEDKKRDTVKHYMRGGYECIDVMKAISTPEEFRGFLKLNALKYLWRLGQKDAPAKDAAKAENYCRWLKESYDEQEPRKEFCSEQESSDASDDEIRDRFIEALDAVAEALDAVADASDDEIRDRLIIEALDAVADAPDEIRDHFIEAFDAVADASYREDDIVDMPQADTCLHGSALGLICSGCSGYARRAV